MYRDQLPDFPYGAVYFRKSNPPQEDWARDYQIASEDGMNTFRHWFFWGSIEIEPGVFDWDDYDRQFDLAAQNGIKTVIAEMITLAPEWAFHDLEHARLETREGKKLESRMHGGCFVGGAPGLCLDNEDYKSAAGNFLRQLVERYRDHPGMGGYDVWNECNYSPDTCYCPATAERFRTWLKERYGDLKTLGEVWHRNSFSEWKNVTPPRDLGPFPQVMDWLDFRIENAYRLMRWRVDLIRELDPVHPIVAHGVVGSLTRMAPGGADDWRAASEVEAFGYTWGSSRHGDEPWKQFHAVDLVRSASRGKPFWHAETYAGPLWMQRNVLNKPRNEGRIATPEDIRFWDLSSYMLGARGMLYLRWRPLLDGPLFGAFGGYGMDGSRTPRSEMVSKVAKWVAAPEQEQLWQSSPIKGELGILYIPETQIFTYAQQASTGFYAQSMQGAYQGFFDSNIQADWVHVDDIDDWDTLYLPFPVMLKQETADRLRSWVEAGGTLVAEGCPGYWGDRAHVGTVQPNLGLDEMFGARESYVEFVPDLLGDYPFNVAGRTVWGGLYLQAYEPTTGTPSGWYEDGRVAAVDHNFGSGKTRLVGTMPGWGYAEHPDDRSAAYWEDVLSFAGLRQHIKCSDPRVKARLQDGDGGAYLWVANPKRQDIPIRLELKEGFGPFSDTQTLWGNEAAIEGQTISLSAGARDVSVIALR